MLNSRSTFSLEIQLDEEAMEAYDRAVNNGGGTVPGLQE
jgi:hypothetical protein